MESLSLIQGKYHKSRKFQKESFTMPNIRNKYTVANANIPTAPITADTDPDTQEAIELQTKMTDLLTRLQQAETENSKFINTFATSVNANSTNTNPYLNKTVQFTTGHICYVTNQGVVKYIASMDIWNTSTAPKEYIQLDIPWNDAWNNVPGITIPTTPPLVSGTFMTLGESLGNEGQNVYVDKLITNTNSTYKGCYADANNALGWWGRHTMSFIGGDPPVAETFITNTNGNFSQSQIANNSYKCLNWDTITVPGWNFNCCLLNNSTDWGYPMPYPNGNQCASIQRTQEFWSDWMSFSPGVTYTISFDACGRNCCDGSGEANPINVGLEGNTFYSFNPPVDKWTKYSTTFTATSGGYRLSFKGTWTASDRSTAIQNVYINTGTSSNSGGTYTYDMCIQAAIDNGYQYFALQDVDKGKKTGYCAVANNITWPKIFGESKIPEKLTVIWSSGTSGSGNYAQINESGSLVVLNSSGANVFSTTPNTNASTVSSNYIGCYQDHGDRAFSHYLNAGGTDNYTSLDKCIQYVGENSLSYYGFQDVKNEGKGQCFATNDLSAAKRYGTATNCAPINGDGRIGGRAWSNAVYSLTPNNKYYLTIGEDGVMAIYLGTGPSDSQTNIWWSGSDTRGKQLDANPQRTAAKSKYGVNFMTNKDQLLYSGDFIASNSGNAYLIMQDDGNLVLYATTMGSNCSIIDSIKYQDIYGGGIGANAIYQLDKVAIPGNMGKNGYVNGESRLSEYPADMMTTGYSEPKQGKISKNLQTIPGYQSWTDGTIEDAKTTCDNVSTCNTILTHTSMPGKYLIANGSTKLGDANGFTSILKINTVDKTKINSTCNSQNPIGIDTIQWEHYLKGLPMTTDTKCSIGKLESLKSKTMDDLNAQLTEVSSKLIDKLNKIEDKNNKMNYRLDQGGKQIRIDVKKYKENAQKILSHSKSMNGRIKANTLEGYTNNNNTNNIVSDSNIVSTQSIYSYIIWSVIATVTVIITIELFTNERNTPLWKLVFLSGIIIITNGLFREYALLVNILIVLMFIISKKFKLMAKENNNV